MKDFEKEMDDAFDRVQTGVTRMALAAYIVIAVLGLGFLGVLVFAIIRFTGG